MKNKDFRIGDNLKQYKDRQNNKGQKKTNYNNAQ